MAIKHLKVSNFKSFKALDISLSQFTTLVGANAAGKTSLIQIFKFIRDIPIYDLHNAISLQGGGKYLRNLTIGSDDPTLIEVVTDQAVTLPLRPKTPSSERMYARSTEITHILALTFNKTGSRYKIADDRLVVKLTFYRGSPAHTVLTPTLNSPDHSVAEGVLTLTVSKRRIRGTLDIRHPPHTAPALDIAQYNFIPAFLTAGAIELPPGQVISFGIPALNYYFPLQRSVPDYLKGIGLYDFDPKLTKHPAPIAGKAELEEDGSNLALILQTVLRDRNNRRQLSNLVRELLPFISGLKVDTSSDKSLLLTLRETYFRKEYLPASALSDGTISVLALILALYFEPKHIIVVEEPERNLHPALLSKLVNLMKDASASRQILVTSHSPDFIKYAGIGSLLLLSRDSAGFTQVQTPANSDRVRSFLMDDIGVDELFARQLLGD